MMCNNKSPLNKRYFVITLIILCFLCVSLSACSRGSIVFPKEIEISYYNFNNSMCDNVVVKQEASGNSRSSSLFYGRCDFSIREIYNTLGFHTETYSYIRYENPTLPIQDFDGWDFLGYSYLSNISTETKYVDDCASIFEQYNAQHGSGQGAPSNISINVFFRKTVASIKLIDKINKYTISYNQIIKVAPNGAVYAKIIENGTLHNKLKQIYVDDIGFEGIYDEPVGGECLINEKFEVLVDASELLDKTLYVHRKLFNVNLLDMNGDLLRSVNLTTHDNMPNLSIDVPQNYKLLGWKMLCSNEVVTEGTAYINGYETLNSEKYADAIHDGIITLIPIIEHDDVELYYDNQVIDCEYGKYLDYIPTSNNEHMIFCGWQYSNGKLFDGFVSDDMKIAPIWSGKNYKFNFNLNGGECEEDLSKIYYKYGDQIIALPNAITKDGYKFIGWFSSPYEDAVQYSNSVGVLIGANNNFSEDNYIIKNGAVTLYAHYVKANN